MWKVVKIVKVKDFMYAYSVLAFLRQKRAYYTYVKRSKGGIQLMYHVLSQAHIHNNINKKICQQF